MQGMLLQDMMAINIAGRKLTLLLMNPVLLQRSTLPRCACMKIACVLSMQAHIAPAR